MIDYARRMTRATWIVVAAIAVPSTSRAEPVAVLAGGLAIPTSDSDWTRLADPSPKVRVGVGTSGIGVMVTLDWTPVSLDNSGGSFGGLGAADIAGHRFRVLANATFDHTVSPKLVLTGRLGAGADIAHASARVTVLGTVTSSADTDVGYGLELAGGLWFVVGSAQVGGELALPIGHHSKHGDGSDGNYTFDYTSYDLDFMFGVRLFSR
jgi:hypothetical protein